MKRAGRKVVLGGNRFAISSGPGTEEPMAKAGAEFNAYRLSIEIGKVREELDQLKASPVASQDATIQAKISSLENEIATKEEERLEFEALAQSLPPDG